MLDKTSGRQRSLWYIRPLERFASRLTKTKAIVRDFSFVRCLRVSRRSLLLKEFGRILGIKATNAVAAPCVFCRCSRATMHNYESLSERRPSFTQCVSVAHLARNTTNPRPKIPINEHLSSPGWTMRVCLALSGKIPGASLCSPELVGLPPV